MLNNGLSGMTGYKWIGKPLPRLEDPPLLIGKSTFIDDIKLPGMLYAAIPSPHCTSSPTCVIKQ